jgi:hypothetical protein
MPPNRQSASIAIGELEPLPTQLASKDPILFQQIRDRLVLLAIQPAGQDGEHHVDGRRVNHGGSLYHGARSAVRVPSTELVGHYALLKMEQRSSCLNCPAQPVLPGVRRERLSAEPGR